MGADKYGKLYYHVELSNGELMWLYADRVEFLEGGGVVFWSKRDKGDFVNMAFAPGKWLTVAAASVIDGGMIAVEHYEAAPKKGASRQRPVAAKKTKRAKTKPKLTPKKELTF